MTDTTTDSPGTAMVPDTETGELVPLTPQTVKAWLDGDDLTDDPDEGVVDLDEAIRILSAENPSEVLAVNEMIKIDDLAGVTFSILGVTWRRSTRGEDGKGRYAVLRCADAKDQEFLTTCGATKVILQVRKAQLAKWLPWEVSLKVTKTDANRTVKELVPPSADF